MGTVKQSEAEGRPRGLGVLPFLDTLLQRDDKRRVTAFVGNGQHAID